MVNPIRNTIQKTRLNRSLGSFSMMILLFVQAIYSSADKNSLSWSLLLSNSSKCKQEKFWKIFHQIEVTHIHQFFRRCNLTKKLDFGDFNLGFYFLYRQRCSVLHMNLVVQYRKPRVFQAQCVFSKNGSSFIHYNYGCCTDVVV